MSSPVLDHLSLGEPYTILSLKGTPPEFYLIGSVASALNRTPQTIRLLAAARCDTASYSDIVFSLLQMLGFRYRPQLAEHPRLALQGRQGRHLGNSAHQYLDPRGLRHRALPPGGDGVRDRRRPQPRGGTLLTPSRSHPRRGPTAAKAEAVRRQVSAASRQRWASSGCPASSNSFAASVRRRLAAVSSPSARARWARASATAPCHAVPCQAAADLSACASQARASSRRPPSTHAIDAGTAIMTWQKMQANGASSLSTASSTTASAASAAGAAEMSVP